MIDRYTTSPQITASVGNLNPPEEIKKDFIKLTDYEHRILDALENPRTYQRLYKDLDIPNPSIRRVMHFLKKKGLVVKNEKNRRWRRVQ